MKIWSSTISFARRFWFATDLIDKTLFLGLMVLVGRVATDPDFGWQLRGGLDLIKSFHIPSFDPYSHTLTNYSWVNHEWLSEGILAFIYQYLGMAMVVLLFALLTIGAFWLALSTFKINRKSKLIILALVFMADMGRWGIRMQVITWFGMAFILWSFAQYRSGRFKHLWWYIPIFCLWANLHGGFTAGLGIFGLLVAIEAVRWLWCTYVIDTPAQSNTIPLLTARQFGHLVLVGILSGAATFINPYGWKLYLDFYHLFTSSFALQNIGEWRPLLDAFNSGSGHWLLFYFIVFFLSAIMVARKIDFARWIVAFVFLLLAWSATRNISFFLLVSAGFIAQAFDYLMAPIAQWLSHRHWMLHTVIGVAGLFVIIPNLWPLFTHANDISVIAQLKSYPLAAIEWARNNPGQVGTKLYNTYNLGGFLDWQLPEHKVFVDGRMAYWHSGEKYPFQDSLDIDAGKPDAIAKMQSLYGVDWVITDPLFPLAVTLKNSSDWVQIFADDVGVIYRKRTIL